MRLIRTGSNRWVVATRRFAFKVPNPSSWRSVLFGLLNNQNEAAARPHPGLCPVLFAVPGGWLVVMPRVRVMTEGEFAGFDHYAFCGDEIPAERKPDSFGWLGERIVCIDYGWT